MWLSPLHTCHRKDATFIDCYVVDGGTNILYHNNLRLWYIRQDMDAVDGLWLFSGLWPLTACWSFVSAVIRASGQTSSLVGRASIFTRCWSNMLANVSITIAMIVAGHYKSSQDSYDECCHCPARFQLIWQPTVSWSPTKVVVSCVLPHQDVCC